MLLDILRNLVVELNQAVHRNGDTDRFNNNDL